ncbi:MAG: DNA polymerase III subunit delta, partial [Bacteroidales bacterium]
RIVKELDKLTIVQNGSGGRITPDLIEKNIGISKEFNNFELLKAVVTKDVLKANRIVNYFRDNPKSNPIVVTNTVLYNYFSKLMLCYYLPDKTENGVIKGLGLKGSFQAKDYMEGMRRYSALKTMQIIGIIRECDARSKGVGNYSNTTHDLLRETIYKILH